MQSRSALLAFLTLMLLAVPAMAQEPQEDVQELADDPAGNATVDGGSDFLDTVLSGVEDAAGGIGDAAEATGESLQEGAAAVGRFIQQAAAAVGHAVAATFRGLAIAGSAVAAGVGAASLATGDGLGSGLASTGSSLGTGLAAIGTGLGVALGAIGSALALVGSAYASFVGSLRPDAMPPIAFAAVVGAGATSTAGVSTWAGWQVLKKWGLVSGGLGGIAGFSRIDDDQLLEHPVRSQIVDTIRDHPGIHASQLARDVGVGWGTVSHHLDKLEKARIVATRKVNNQKCYFEQGGQVSREDMQVASAVKGDTAGAIAAYVHHHPMSSQKVLAEALDISPALASFHVKKLVNLGVLEKMRHGKEMLLTTSGAMRRLLEADRSFLAAMDARAAEALQYSA